jgi:hypothetical protein
MNVGKLSGAERVARAKERADKLVGHIATLFMMHEANALIVYSPKLAEQIPRSYAAHAFNHFQSSMLLFEIVRLCALWDSPRPDRESIPTIIKLFNEPALVEQIARATYDPYAIDASSDPQDVAARKVRSAFAQEAEQAVRRRLAFAASKSAEVLASPRLKALKHYRDTYIAHTLTLPEPDMKTEEDVAPMRYGYETALLDDTVAVADALHHGLNGTSFDWEESKQIARKNAAALWENCAFHIPRGSRSHG